MILIAPFAKPLMNGKTNPKNYPYWKELLALISEEVVQVGVDGEEQITQQFLKNLPIARLRELIVECRIWIGCDSFFQHLAWDCNKPGVVLWSVSDPLIYGHPENINLLKSRDYLAQNQFLWWDFTEYNPDAFLKPEEVIKYIL
jgi:ADP-heptose:LPS heptosyltransferase